MNKEQTYGIIGLLLGVILTIAIASNAVNNNNSGMMRVMGMNPLDTTGNELTSSPMMGDHDNDMTMENMVGNLKGKTGDEFDKLFITEMIDHHQGAIDMATLAKQHAKHDEIKKLADDIISAQTTEINQMKDWQKSWDY